MSTSHKNTLCKEQSSVCDCHLVSISSLARPQWNLIGSIHSLTMFWLAATVMRPEAFSLSVQTHYLSMKARGVPYAPARGSSSFKAWEEHFTLFDLTATPLRNIYGNHKHHCPPVTGVKCNICSSESTDSTSEMSLSGHSERLRGFSGCFVILLSWFCLCLFWPYAVYCTRRSIIVIYQNK